MSLFHDLRLDEVAVARRRDRPAPTRRRHGAGDRARPRLSDSATSTSRSGRSKLVDDLPTRSRGGPRRSRRTPASYRARSRLPGPPEREAGRDSARLSPDSSSAESGDREPPSRCPRGTSAGPSPPASFPCENREPWRGCDTSGRPARSSASTAASGHRDRELLTAGSDILDLGDDAHCWGLGRPASGRRCGSCGGALVRKGGLEPPTPEGTRS